MNYRCGGNRLLVEFRAGASVALLGFLSSAAAEPPFEHITHNSFEACWSQSKDATSLAALIVDSVEGAPGCIPAVTNSATTNYCYTSVCSGGQAGCPTVLHGATSQLHQGTTSFDTQGGLDSVAGKVTIPITGECDFTIDTSNVVLNYTIDYSALEYYGLVPDGNNGYWLSVAHAANVTVQGLTSNQVSLSGSLPCSISSPSVALFNGILAGAQDSIESAVQPTLAYPWCPWPF